MNPNSEGIRAIHQDEHNPDAHAKRVVQRYQDPNSGGWFNFVPAKVPGVDFDYLSIASSGADQDTLTFKLGGSGGTTIQTIVIDYAPGAAKASDDLSALTWS